jgi:hypothetical protein
MPVKTQRQSPIIRTPEQRDAISRMKACENCGGLLIHQRDFNGRYAECMQCGNILDY